MTKWLGWFYRFHADPPGRYIPYALHTVDCLVTVDGSAPALHRCVREVVKFNGIEGVEWKLITWVPGLPGVQFETCATATEAMNRMARPPQPVRFVKEAPARTSP